MSAQERWIDAWFRPVSARPLAALRVGLSLLLLVHLLWISGDVLSLYGSRGIIPWELTDLMRDPWVPGLPTLAKALVPLGISERAAIILLLSGYGGSLLALALGLHTRVAALLSWGLHVSLMTSSFASFYGADQIAKTFLFYLVVFPSGRAHTLVPARNEETIPVGCLRVLQAHLCVVYLGAGLDKASGVQWWNGEAIWQAVSQPIFSTFDLTWLARHSWVAVLAGWATLIVEIGYAPLVWPRRTRTAWCVATIGLHLGLALFMGLVFFSSIMILLTSCLFLIPEEVSERSVAWSKRPILSALLVFLTVALIGRDARADERSSFDDYPALIRRVMARDRIPGLAVGVVENGRLVFARGFGERDVANHLPVTPDTLFSIGSCSKAFTATAVAILADEGAIDLDAPVRTYLSDFFLADPRASASATPRDLLTHRTGLPRHDLFWYRAPLSRDELYARLRFLEPAKDKRWRYNSVMFVVAGRIVEKVSGQSWESFVANRVLRPLGMRRTLLSVEAMENDPDHATPYALHDGRWQKLTAMDRANAMAPAGGVHTTVNDLARWLTFHATRSPELLGDRMWRELHRPQADMPAPAEPLVQHPRYALGWIHESYRGHALIVHNGATDGFTVHLGYLPETGQGVILLSNRDLAAEAVMVLAYSAYDRLLGLEPLNWESRLRETPAKLQPVRAIALDLPIETLVGRYEHPAYGPLTIGAQGNELTLVFRTLRSTLAYQGDRRFLAREPMMDGAPQLTVRFSTSEPMKLFVPLDFDEGDPVEVFTRARE